MSQTSEFLISLDVFTTAYVTCALWSSGLALDASGLDSLALRQMIIDCKYFRAINSGMLAAAGTEEQNGHDFWLSRNRHHGAGFWARDYQNGIGEGLTKAAHAFGECNLHVGADGKIHLWPQLPTKYYEIRPTDVGKATVRAFEKTWMVADFIGRILPKDVGKRVYRVGEILQVENDEQFQTRMEKTR